MEKQNKPNKPKDPNRDTILAQVEEMLDPHSTDDTFTVTDTDGTTSTWKILHLSNYHAKRWRAAMRHLDRLTLETVLSLVTGKSDSEDTAGNVLATREAAEDCYPLALAYLLRWQDPNFKPGKNPDDVEEIAKWLDEQMTFGEMQQVVFAIERKLEHQKNLLGYWMTIADGTLRAVGKGGLISVLEKLGITPLLSQYLGQNTNSNTQTELSPGISTENSSETTSPQAAPTVPGEGSNRVQ